MRPKGRPYVLRVGAKNLLAGPCLCSQVLFPSFQGLFARDFFPFPLGPQQYLPFIRFHLEDFRIVFPFRDIGLWALVSLEALLSHGSMGDMGGEPSEGTI